MGTQSQIIQWILLISELWSNDKSYETFILFLNRFIELENLYLILEKREMIVQQAKDGLTFIKWGHGCLWFLNEDLEEVVIFNIFIVGI